MNGPIRLRQHGYACSQNICTVCNIFANKPGFFRPAGGESGRLSRQMPGWEPTAYVLLLTGVTRLTCKSDVITPWKPDAPPAEWKRSDLVRKKIHNVNFFANKKKVPCCRRRIGLPSGHMSSLCTHRVTPVIDLSYAIPDPEKHFASGRAEEDKLFHKNVALCATFL